MTREEGRAYQARRKLVREVERQELRSTPIATTFQQLAAMMASAKALDWDEALAAEDAVFWERWQRVRKAYGV
jgi:hypothetical protein